MADSAQIPVPRNYRVLKKTNQSSKKAKTHTHTHEIIPPLTLAASPRGWGSAPRLFPPLPTAPCLGSACHTLRWAQRRCLPLRHGGGHRPGADSAGSAGGNSGFSTGAEVGRTWVAAWWGGAQASESEVAVVRVCESFLHVARSVPRMEDDGRSTALKQTMTSHWLS